MCGRYVSVRSDSDILAAFDALDATDDDEAVADFNVAPTKPVRVIVDRPLHDKNGNAAPTPTRQLRVVTWGLVPSWAKDRTTAGRMFNARVESLSSKPAFRSAYAKRRCLVPADGWYEWQALDGPTKQPMYMSAEDGHVLAFAGLYEFWRGGDGPTVTTCTIITTPSQGALAAIHDRMPLVLPRPAWTRWLDPGVADPGDLLQAWDEADGERLELRPVSTKVNKVANAGPSLIERAESLVETPTLF